MDALRGSGLEIEPSLSEDESSEDEETAGVSYGFEIPDLQDAHLPSVLAFLLLLDDFFGAVFGGAILN